MKKLSNATQNALNEFLQSYPMSSMQKPSDAILKRLFAQSIPHDEFCLLNDIHEAMRKQAEIVKKSIKLKGNGWMWCSSCEFGDPHYKSGCPECEKRMKEFGNE